MTTPRFLALDPAAYRTEALRQGVRYTFEDLSDAGIPNYSLDAAGTLGAIEAGRVYPVVGVVYTVEDLKAKRDPRVFRTESVAHAA